MLNSIYGSLIEDHEDFYADPTNQTGVSVALMDTVREKITNMIVDEAHETARGATEIRPIVKRTQP